MESVLDVYQEAYNEKQPIVCFDEMTKQLIEEVQTPIPPQKGQQQRIDYEYKRNGTSNIFIFFEALAGWRHAEVTNQRRKIDFAHCMKWLVDDVYPDVEKVRVVLDNLNTHKKSSLYATFLPNEAHRISRKLEFIYTPKHGSWLNMAEIELSVLSAQCLDRRIPTKEMLISEVKAWEQDRNKKATKTNWQFTTEDARVKLKRLYPSFDVC